MLAELGRLGNLLSVQASHTAFGQQIRAAGHGRRHGGAHRPGHQRDPDRQRGQRLRLPQPFVPAIDTNGISVTATDASLPATLGASLAHGAFLNAATARYPAVVLGAEAASLLGIHSLSTPPRCGWGATGSPWSASSSRSSW